MSEKTPRLMTVAEVAKELRVSPKTLLNWRSRGIGPVGFRVGRSVLFEPEAVERYLQARRSADAIGARSA